MNQIKIWLLSQATWALKEGLLPVYGGGCAVWRDKLFMIGGSTASAKLSEDILVLDLGGDRNWRVASKHPASQLGSSVTSVNMDKEGIYFIGGTMPNNAIPIKIYDPIKHTITPFKDEVQVHSKLPKKIHSILGGSLVKNELIPSELIYYGGRVVQPKNNDTGIVLKELEIIGTVRNRKVYTNRNGQPSWAQAAGIFNGTMYAIGGSNNSRILGEGNSQVRAYSIKEDSWTELSASGPEPPSAAGYSFTQYSHYIYMVGGESDILSRLDLRNLTWSSTRVPGLVGRSRGCLSYYNGHLIHAFGLVSYKPVINTQFINLKTGDLASELPPDNQSYWGTALFYFVLIVGGLIIVILSFVTFYERRKQPDEMQPPKIFTEHVWADGPMRSSFLVDFDHVPTIDCDVSSSPTDSTVVSPSRAQTRSLRSVDSNSILIVHPRTEG